MTRMLTQRDVSEGMVAGCPWGTDLRQWTPAMLERGTEECAGNSPRLFAALRAEQDRRAGR